MLLATLRGPARGHARVSYRAFCPAMTKHGRVFFSCCESICRAGLFHRRRPRERLLLSCTRRSTRSKFVFYSGTPLTRREQRERWLHAGFGTIGILKNFCGDASDWAWIKRKKFTSCDRSCYWRSPSSRASRLDRRFSNDEDRRGDGLGSVLVLNQTRAVTCDR